MVRRLKAGDIIYFKTSDLNVLEEKALSKLFWLTYSVSSHSLWYGFDEAINWQRDGVYLAFNVLTEKLLGKQNLQPGDVDVLIVPYKDEEPLFSMAIAIEMKVVRPTLAKRGKSSNRLGSTQLNGLLLAGFPYIGLLHLVIPERSPREEYRELMAAEIVNPETGEVRIIGPMQVDTFPSIAADRNAGRMQAMGLPECAAAISVGLSVRNSPLGIDGHTPPVGQRAKMNPHANSETVAAIAKVFCGE